ncbi:MAG: UvrD-helicase domain-containing protein, partial [Clostridiaceae bacterium]|nr:UvrD-helicase domain-containing protein [Clostridiaceae bacterium]
MGKPNIFMVGDVKQSIYRFRQAKPELFLEKYNRYSSEKGEKYRKIQLFKNFRSRRNVIDTVNFIFSKIMSEEVGELNYDEKEALNFGATIYDEADNASVSAANSLSASTSSASAANSLYSTTNASIATTNVSITDRNTELHIIEMEDEDNISSEEETGDVTADVATSGSVTNYENEDVYTNENNYDLNGSLKDIYGLFSDEPLDNIKCEARLVSQKIHELMGSFRVYDNRIKSYRPVEYRDIVILLRSTRSWSDVFVEELSLQGIPVYADVGSGFFKTTEVQIMLSLLQIIDNPLQDIPLLAVLRAPFTAFTPDELADIRLVDKEATLYEALAKASGMEKYIRIYDSNIHDNSTPVDDNITIDEKLQAKVVKFLETLENWRNKALYMSTDELIWYLYTDTGFYSFVGAMPGGEQRQANLRMLFEQARKFEETSYRGLFNFINFISKIKVSQGDMGSAKILGENENVVRIMSIHKSKGLEFPVVFLSGCGKGFNLQDLNKNIILHQELGFGPDYVDHEKRISYPTMAKQALRYQIKKESLSEEMRILYVALTRAKEKLILTGTVKNASTSLTRWKEYSMINSEKIPSYIILKGRNFLEWICPALIQNEEYEHNITIWNKGQFKIENAKETNNAENVNNSDNINNACNTDNVDDKNKINMIMTEETNSIDSINNSV